MSTLTTVGLVVLATVAIYAVALTGIRLVGRRTVSHMSAFDFLITVAVGTIVGTGATRPSTWVETTTAIVVLLALQSLVGWLRHRSDAFRRLVDFAPIHVIRQGRIAGEGLRGPRGPQMTEDDVAAKLRTAGYRSAEDVEEAILENTGELSAFGRRDDRDD